MATTDVQCPKRGRSPQARPAFDLLLRRAVSRARMLFEPPLFAADVGPLSDDKDERIGGHVRAWTEALDDEGRPERLERFLAWEGLADEGWRQILHGGTAADAVSLPSWAEVLRQVARIRNDDPAEDGDAPAEKVTTRAIPFEEVFEPFVALWKSRLAERSGELQLLRRGALGQLADWLKVMLSEAAAQALYLEFHLFRTQTMAPLDLVLLDRGDRVSTAMYQRFVRHLLGTGFEAFLERYPVLARQLGSLTEQWVDRCVELVARLAADGHGLAERFVGGRRLGRVRAIDPGLSDPHEGGRTVLAITFESGLRMAYKPRSLGIEAAYQRLLVWLDERGAPISLKSLTVWDRGDYGWMEWVEARPCVGADRVGSYYRRCGALLAVIELLRGVDCHAENIVACGDHPVLVDCEALLHPRLASDHHESGGGEAWQQARRSLDDSVLATGLLPRWRTAGDGTAAFDVSGLGNFEVQRVAQRRPRWRHLNSDRMMLEARPGITQPSRNLPTLDGEPVSLEQYQDTIVDGYEQMYRFVLAGRRALLAPGSPLDAFRQVRLRFIPRPTQVYAALLERLRHPRYLHHGLSFSLPLEMLARTYLAEDEPPANWPMLRAERVAMQRLDIPLFRAAADSTDVSSGRDRIARGVFQQSGHASVLARLDQLGDEDLERQKALINASLHLRLGSHDAATSPRGPSRSSALAAAPCYHGCLVAAATRLAEELERRAVRGTDGSIAWVGPRFMAQAGRFDLTVLGPSFYDGAPGVALFLAALHRIVPAREFGDLARRALQPILATVAPQEIDRSGARFLGIGGGNGVGGLLYALVRTGSWLDDGLLLEAAQNALTLLTPERIAEETHADVLSGLAGAVLGLMTYHEVTGASPALARATLCGERLLALRQTSPAGPRAWSSLGGRFLAGFSHGASGIAYALTRLFRVTGESAFRRAAEEALDYEAEMFDARHGNWPDLRPQAAAGEDGAPPLPVAWCHGAAGVALARLGCQGALGSARLDRDIEVALETIEGSLGGSDAVDNLCCGVFGRVEALVSAAQCLGRPALGRVAEREVRRVLSGCREGADLRLSTVLPRGVYCPGLFQGAAGVGYSLLRVARPDVVPSVLLYE